MANPKCPECGAATEAGFIPDATYGGFIEAHWQRGAPEKVTMLGIPAGVRAMGTRMTPIRALRCTGCGLLRLYAPPKVGGR